MGYYWRLQPVHGRVKTSCSIRTVCQCYFCVFNLWFLNSLYTWRPTEKIEMRKGSYDKGMKFKLKSTTFSWAVSSSHMALAKAGLLLPYIKSWESTSHVLIPFTQIQVIKLPFELSQVRVRHLWGWYINKQVSKDPVSIPALPVSC